MKRLFVYLIYSDNNHLVPLFKLFMSEWGTESRYRRRYLFDSLSIPLLNVLLGKGSARTLFRRRANNWRLQSFSLLFCNRRLSEKIVLASIKEEGIEKAWRLPILMDLDDLEPRFVYCRPLKCTINKQLHCRVTALYVHCVNLLKHIYVYSLKAVWTT